MTTNKQAVARLLRELRGAPLSLLFAFFALDRSLSRQDLLAIAAYSRPSVDKARIYLESQGYIQAIPGTSSYQLTARSNQLLLAPPKVKVLPRATSIGSSSNTIDINTDILLPKTNSEKVKILPMDEDATDAVEGLVKNGIVRTAASGKGALDSVQTALKAGMTGTECYNCIDAWLEYADTDKGAWIKSPHAMAAAKLRAGVWPPKVEKTLTWADFQSESLPTPHHEPHVRTVWDNILDYLSISMMKAPFDKLFAGSAQASITEDILTVRLKDKGSLGWMPRYVDILKRSAEYCNVTQKIEFID